MNDPDYLGPTWYREGREGYLSLDNTQEVASTEELASGSDFRILIDRDAYGNVLGLEVLW